LGNKFFFSSPRSKPRLRNDDQRRLTRWKSGALVFEKKWRAFLSPDERARFFTAIARAQCDQDCSGTDATILKVFSPKILAKNGAFSLNYC
jgi:hypothetical protein